MFFMTDTLSSIQQGTSWVHQKEIRGKRLLLNFTKVISTSKASLFLSLQTTHISASGATLQVLQLFLLLYFKLNINPFTMPGVNNKFQTIGFTTITSKATDNESGLVLHFLTEKTPTKLLLLLAK